MLFTYWGTFLNDITDTEYLVNFDLTPASVAFNIAFGGVILPDLEIKLVHTIHVVFSGF